MKVGEVFTNIAVGTVIILSMPVIAVKAISDYVKGDKPKKREIEVHEVDLSKCDPETREWAKRCYEKKNGIV